MALGKSDGSVYIDTRVDTKGFQTGIEGMGKGIKGLGGAVSKLGIIMAAVFSVKLLADFSKKAVESAAEYEASVSQFSQVFGNMKNEAYENLEAISESTGILTERLKSSYTQMAAFAKTTGMTSEESMEIANRAIVAVADSAAFYDRSLEEVTESMRSFLKGNYANDAALGLSATEYTRNAAALKLYGKEFQNLSEAQKQLTLLQMVEDANALSGAMGQAARESDTWSNVTGNLSQSVKDLTTTLGRTLLPAAITLVKAITEIVVSIDSLLKKILHLENVLASGNAQDVTEQVAENYEQIAESTEKAIKAQNKYLSGIDELNVMNKSSGSTDVAGITPIDTAASEQSNASLGETESILDRIKSQVFEITGLLAQQFANPFATIKEFLIEFKENIFTLFVDPFNQSKDTLFDSLLSVKEGFVNLWTNIKPILSDLFYGVFDLYHKYLAPIFSELAPKVTDFFQNHLAPVFVKLGDFLGVLGQGLLDIWEYWKPLMSILIDTLMPVVAPILESVGEIFIDVFNSIFDIIGGVIDALSGLVEFIAGTFTGDWDRAWNGIVQIFVGIWDALKSAVETFINATIKLINGLIEGINSISAPIGIPAIPTIPLFSLDVPQLAKGAVIPPNAPFMAMLGDQRNGTNIEAPADLIRQIVREESANAELLSYLADIARNTRETANKDMSVNIGDRDIARANARGQRAMGYSLITEG